MINEKQTKKFCCEDAAFIENYWEAINDDTQTWDIHHRNEIRLQKSARELIEMGLYYDRPSSELIFLTRSEHTRLHQTGSNNVMWGKNHTEISRQKMKEAKLKTS